MFICATSFAQFTSSEGAAIENSNSGKNGFYIQYNSIGSICTLGNEHESTLYGREWEYLKERINDYIDLAINEVSKEDIVTLKKEQK